MGKGEALTEESTIPHSRRATGAVIHAGAFWIYGGFGVTGTTEAHDVGGDLWCYRGCWKRLSREGPYPARYPSLCSGPDAFYLFGGCSHDGAHVTFENDLWRYDGSWSLLTNKKEEGPRGRYTSALAAGGGTLFMFGGQSQSPGGDKFYYGDLWGFHLKAGKWEKLHGDEQGPGSRYGFGWAADPHSLYIYGGYDGFRELGDLWRLDLNSLVWERLEHSGPSPRYCPALGIVPEGLILFGGRSKVNAKKNFADTWIFDGRWRLSNALSGAEGPGYHAKPAYASDGKALWIFGGEGPLGHVSDLWRYQDGSWHEIHGARDDDPVLW